MERFRRFRKPPKPLTISFLYVHYLHSNVMFMKTEIISVQTDASGQAIRIPDSLRIDDDKVYVKKSGNVLHIIPFHSPWQNVFDSVNDFSADFMEDRNQPFNQQRESFE